MKHLGTKTIETERLILRKFELTDIEDMYNNFANDDDVTRYITWPAHKSIEETKKVVQGYVNDSERDNYYHWCIVLKETNEVIGSIGAPRMFDDLKLFEVGYVIGKRFWNKGIMTEAMKPLLKFFFEEVGVNRIEARHDTKNPGSGKVMVKSGMQIEGILRQAGKNNTGICDSAIYSILKEDYERMNKKIFKA
ncbi:MULTISPECIES: GNAT family N-acetyltransferase [Sedimentibacter]|uniref:GNAT family N-acetyltransferase n=1 Tax=Sedimentibacter hydroxybenzoicus DSM 7310 TaxID=1123245 RepID=A0A974BL54_SEDHY|nr:MULTISPECIES: GNAT family N-acetyltransferase [Sedimentibacter]NYB75359.1 GNAT family N-acetyltransferase [Sedimentibacter hydroxybenzoicus DSM 7310]